MADRSDESRFRFLAEHQLSITWYDDGASLFWRGKAKPGQAGAYLPVARGRTLQEAVDTAIDRWEKQHGKRWE